MSLLGWFTFLHKSLFVILTVLLFWNYLFLLILVFVLQWSFLHWEILIMLLSHFPLTFIQTQRLFLIFVLTGPAFMITWDIFEIYLRISLNLRFFYGSIIQKFFDATIPQHKYQVKLHSPPWFSATCTAAIAHRNLFFYFYWQNISSTSKVKFKQANYHCKYVLEVAKLAYFKKTKRLSL